jgi:YesN/AraC family two-component response regulator
MHDQTVVNIIIADDHQLVVDGIKSMLAGEPLYKIVGEASNGQEALDKITACPQQYHILLTDISMPLLSGIDLCKAVKHQHPHIKVLVLSMYNSAPIVREAIAAYIKLVTTVHTTPMLSCLSYIARFRKRKSKNKNLLYLRKENWKY